MLSGISTYRGFRRARPSLCRRRSQNTRLAAALMVSATINQKVSTNRRYSSVIADLSD